jgi:hypothetical protein
MKLCPLFESIKLHWHDPRDPRERYLCSRTLEAANATLPREAIETAIDLMQDVADAVTGARGLWASAPLLKDIEQLRAMLPEEEK